MEQDAVPVGIERWDRKFREQPEQFFFGREPSELARLTLQYWRQIHGEDRGRVLDLGCGEGRDAVHFARQGFDVTAVDGSETALNKLRRLADESAASIGRIVQMDARDVSADPEYRLVFSHNCLQFLGDDCLPSLLNHQKAAGPGTIHAISVFTREAESLIGQEGLYRFDHNELKFHYRGWRLLFYGEEMLWREPANMYLSFARIIAVKTGGAT